MIEAEFCGGPWCGRVQCMHAAIERIQFAPASQGAAQSHAKPKPGCQQRGLFHLYRLRAGTPMGLSHGFVFYEYQGIRRE